MDLSFIIPAHNAKKTLARAVTSITEALKHTTLTYEILIVENGSTDQTKKLAQQLAQDDKKITMLTSRLGVSNARNKGLECALGENIIFVDADDYLLAKSAPVLEAYFKSKPSDLGVFSYEVGQTKFLASQKPKTHQADVFSFKEQMLKNPTKYMTVWAKILKKSIILENKLVFNSDLRLAEDGDFMLQYLTKCQKISVSPQMFYHYATDNDASAVRKFDGKKAKDYQKALVTSKNYLTKYAKELLPAFNYYILMHLNVIMVREVFAQNNLSYWDQIKWCKKIVQTNIFLTALKKISLSQCKTPRLVSILFLKLHWYILASLVFKVRIKQNKVNAKGNK